MHPAVLEAYAEGTLLKALQVEANTSWRREELAVIQLVSAYKIATTLETGSKQAA